MDKYITNRNLDRLFMISIDVGLAKQPGRMHVDPRLDCTEIAV